MIYQSFPYNQKRTTEHPTVRNNQSPQSMQRGRTCPNKLAGTKFLKLVHVEQNEPSRRNVSHPPSVVAKNCKRLRQLSCRAGSPDFRVNIYTGDFPPTQNGGLMICDSCSCVIRLTLAFVSLLSKKAYRWDLLGVSGTLGAKEPNPIHR